MATPAAPQLWLDVVAQVLDQTQRYMTHSGEHQGRPYDSVTLNDVMVHLPDVDDDRTVELVLDACLQNCPVSCVCLAAVRYDRVEILLRSAPTFEPELEDPFWREALQYLVDHACWKSTQALLARGTGRVCWNILGREATASFQDHPAAVAVFDLLAARCLESECSCVGDVAACVASRGMADWFRTLVYSGNATVRQCVMESVSKLIFHNVVHRHDPEIHPGSDFNGCLAVACEAGLFTAEAMGQDSGHPTVMGWAVCSNQPDLVRFLYHAGATDNRELVQLNRYPALVAKTRGNPANVLQSPTNGDYPTFQDVDTAKSILGFLARVASTPRSLETLCLLWVSRELGWGHGRESRIEQLNIPRTSKQALKFEGRKEFLKYPSTT